MFDTALQVFYIALTAALAVGFWKIRPWLIDRGHTSLSWYAKSLAIACAIIVPLHIEDALKGLEPPTPGLFAGAILIMGALVSLVRNIIGWFAGKMGFGGGDGHMRGAMLADEQSVAKQLKKVQSRFSVGSVPVPTELETRGFLLAGSPGTGKSQTLTHALDALRSAGQRAVVADASGIYTSRYYTEGRDVIVNPFDNRCAPWSPLAELETVADIPALAKSLVPDGENATQAEWNGYAQNFTEAVLEYCFENGLTNGELYHYIVSAPEEELREICAGTPAEALLTEANIRMFANIRAIASSNARFLRYLDPAADAKNGFSIRRFLVNEEHNGWLFLSYQQQHRDALKSMIACCVDIASRTVLSLPPSQTRRVIFGLDELPLLGRVQSIVELATNGRKHGAMLFCGLQTIAQVRDTYGPNTSQTLLACLGSWLVLRVSDGETAEYMSRYLGEEEKTRVVRSGGESSQGMMKGSTSENWSEQVVTSRVVLPSELQQLPDLRGIFNLAGPTPSAVVNLQVAAPHHEAEAFIAAPPRERAKRPAKAQEEQGGAGGGNVRDAQAEAQADMLDLL